VVAEEGVAELRGLIERLRPALGCDGIVPENTPAAIWDATTVDV
jgi:hypothetical protein